MTLAITETRQTFSLDSKCNRRRQKIFIIFHSEPEKTFMFPEIAGYFTNTGPKSLRRDIKYLVEKKLVKSIHLLTDTRRIGYRLVIT
jgi:hypothetical protein